MADLKLSIIDVLPVREDQTSSDAIAATLTLGRTADDLGYHRYWVAEHHNMPQMAATSPPLMVALLAAATRQIRVGSGGVMLPNHAPLVVAEQFAMLEAAFPGRIDLGVGRASGADAVTAYALRHGAGGVSDDAVSRFPEYIDNLRAMMKPSGVGVALNGRTQRLTATPVASSVPTTWLLGSSPYSARLAGEKGMPYVFAHHFSGQGTAEALDLYRSAFQPSPDLEAPRVFITANVIAAETEEEAHALALPNLLMFLAGQTGSPLVAQPSVEDAARVELSKAHRRLIESIRASWVLGTPEQVAAQLAELSSEHGVDEVMINPVAGSRRGTDPTISNREETLRLLAK